MLFKRLYIVFIFLTLVGTTWSQSDQDFVFWQKAIGGAGEDELNGMVKDVDGSIYIVGSIQADGRQTMDILVSKYDAHGSEVWTKKIGELGDDRGVAIELMNNELFVVASSNSNSGIFSNNAGREDVYLLRLNLSGDLIATSHFGGNVTDLPSDISKTANGELLISAHSKSNFGVFDSNNGQSDIWVMRVNAQGELIWKQNFGGSDEDFSAKIKETATGEIVLLGHSLSFDGDIGVNYGDLDLSMFKLAANGSVIWEQNYGGAQAEVGIDLLLEPNGQIIIAANTLSQSFDIAKNAGFSDAWVLEIDPQSGEIVWEETHGTRSGDYASALSMDGNGQLYLIGTTNAELFEGQTSAGNDDAWLAKVNSPESIEHVALFGGEGFESVSAFTFNADGSIVLIGASNSNDGFFTGNAGKSDGWLMKFELQNESSVGSEIEISAHPNPTTGIVYLNNLTDSDEIIVYNPMGQIIQNFQSEGFSQSLDLTNVAPGIYLVNVNRGSESETLRLVRN